MTARARRRRPRTPRPPGCGGGAPRAARRPRARRGAPSIASQSSSMPSPRIASVSTIGGCGPDGAEREHLPHVVRASAAACGWSGLLIAITSGISMIPAFSACTESPEPGISTSTTVSAIESTPTSLWPVPTVSRKTTSLPDASSSSSACSVDSARPPRVAARAHRADEDAGVEEVVGEPDAVAEQRAVRERARRVDRDRRRRSARGAHVARRARRSGSTCRRPGEPVNPTACARPVSG